MPVTSLSRRADGSRIATSETLAPAGSASRPAIVAGFVSSALIESSTRLLVALETDGRVVKHATVAVVVDENAQSLETLRSR